MTRNQKLTQADLLPFEKRVPRAHVRSVLLVLLIEVALIAAIGVSIGAPL